MAAKPADIGCRTCYESIETRCSPCDECGHIDEEDGADEQRVTAAEGCKQVLLDGQHLADAVTPEAAAVIAICLKNAGVPGGTWTRAERQRVQNFFE